jgi:hypothetical protein
MVSLFDCACLYEDSIKRQNVLKNVLTALKEFFLFKDLKLM